MPLKNTGVLDIDGWSLRRKKLPCPRHIRPATCQPPSRARAHPRTSVFTSQLTHSGLVMMLYNSIEYHIIYISTYIHNCFYYNATFCMKMLGAVPCLPPQLTDCLHHPHTFCILLLLLLCIPHQPQETVPEKESICPIEQSTSLLPKISSWRHSMQLLLFPSIFLSEHMMIFFQEICPIPF